MKTKKVVTFKVHRVLASTSEEKITLHQLDPHEHTDPALKAVNDLTEGAPNSGLSKIHLMITAKDQFGEFRVGQLVKVTLEKHG